MGSVVVLQQQMMQRKFAALMDRLLPHTMAMTTAPTCQTALLAGATHSAEVGAAKAMQGDSKRELVKVCALQERAATATDSARMGSVDVPQQLMVPRKSAALMDRLLPHTMAMTTAPTCQTALLAGATPSAEVGAAKAMQGDSKGVLVKVCALQERAAKAMDSARTGPAEEPAQTMMLPRSAAHTEAVWTPLEASTIAPTCHLALDAGAMPCARMETAKATDMVCREETAIKLTTLVIRKMKNATMVATLLKTLLNTSFNNIGLFPPVFLSFLPHHKSTFLCFPGYYYSLPD